MPAPTRDEIRRKALELFYSVPHHVGVPPPEDDELKERNLWREAQIILLRGFAREIGAEIQKGIEEPERITDEYLDYLSDRLKELEAQIAEVKATRKRRAVRPILPMPTPDLISLKHTAEHYLFLAYAGDPIVTTWLRARGLTTDDLEAEINRLDLAIMGERVGPPNVDILRMDVEIDEKRRILERLLRLEELFDRVVRGVGGARVEMETMGFPTQEALERELMRLRQLVADPPSHLGVESVERMERVLRRAMGRQASGGGSPSHEKLEILPPMVVVPPPVTEEEFEPLPLTREEVAGIAEELGLETNPAVVEQEVVTVPIVARFPLKMKAGRYNLFSREDMSYVAAALESEGTAYISVIRERGKPERKIPVLEIEVGARSCGISFKVARLTGAGFRQGLRGIKKTGKLRPICVVRAYGARVARILRDVLPFMQDDSRKAEYQRFYEEVARPYAIRALTFPESRARIERELGIPAVPEEF
jgi:hypothetical protein